MQPFEFPNLVRFAPTPNEPDNLGNLYVPSQSMALLTRFIFWKVEHREASTPSYESAKESVLSVWKTQKAAELAEAKAKEIAAKVGTSPLVEVLDEQTQRSLVVTPSPFSWFNPLVANFDIQLSNVEGLRPIGPDFMEKVFSSPAGSTVVVPDASREIYYVVKVARFLPGDDDLMVQFSQAPTTTGIQNISNLESSNSIRSWFAAIQKQLGFQSR